MQQMWVQSLVEELKSHKQPKQDRNNIVTNLIKTLKMVPIKKKKKLPWWLSGKEPVCQCKRRWVQSMGQEDPLEEEMATHLQYSWLENPMDRGA